MHSTSPKRAILAGLCGTEDLRGLDRLPSFASREGQALLRWMDRAGLALYFWRKLQLRDAANAISSDWRSALEQRHVDNAARTADMMGEFRQLIATFERRSIKAVVLKGFSLVADFCEDSALRHQTDLDFLVAPKDVKDVAAALQAHGYAADHVSDSGETCFTTPMQRIPSTEDYLYAPQHQRQLDLHVSLWEPSPWLDIGTPNDSMYFAERRTLNGIEFWSLSLADNFLNQALHLFRHSMRSWIRLSWLLELARCIESRQEDTSLWTRVAARAGESVAMKKALAFVLGLADRLFGVPMPGIFQRWLAGTDTARLEAWLMQFGFEWAVAEWPGSLSNLFVASEFIPDTSLRAQYWRSRLLPRKANASIGTITAEDAKSFARLQATRMQYLTRRATAHVKDICGLPVQGLRWRRALESVRRNAVATNS